MSTDVYLQAHTNRQTIIPNCTKSTEIIPKYTRAQKSNHNSHNQLYEHIEEKEIDISDTLRNDRIADDRSFMPGDFKDSSVRKSQKYDSSCMTKDAQIQTSSRKSLRRRKMKTRSKPVAEKISRRNDNESSRIVADFRAARSHGKRNYCDEPWLRVRAREKKRAEYVDKFTAVNRQIEEITATLRETCCDGEDSARDNLENCDEYFSSISDDAKVSAMNRSGVENGLNIAGGRTASEEKNGLVNVMRIEGGSRSDLCNKTVREISHVDNLNKETVSEETLASRNLEKIPNNADRDSVRAIKETVYSSNRISRSKIKAKYLFDLDLAKKDDELQERSIESEPFNKVCPKNNFAILRNDERARKSAESLANLGDSRYCKIIEEKLGETAVLKDIKRRIDRDFDGPPAERSENDAEDFLTVSRKSSDLHNVIDVTSATTIEEFKSTPLIASTNLEPTETEIHGSMSISAMSECSNKNSTPSKYFSCTRIPSLMSLTRNEDELAALETVDCSTIVHDSHSNLHSNYYDSCSNLSSNHRSLSNLDSSFDRSRSSLEYIAQYACPNKFPAVETANEPYDTFEVSDDRESFAENKIRERSLLGDDKSSRKEWRGEKQYAADSTLETSKSSRYVGSIDSGVFSSSLIDLHPAEDSFDVDGTEFKEKSYAGKLDELSGVDSASDSNCTDDTLDRKVNNVVRDLTKNLILCERKARMKLKARDARYVRIHKLIKNLKISTVILVSKSHQFSSKLHIEKKD